jgi:G6PDH family F420-dependent oxidoreductase
MLSDAIDIISLLFDGGYVDYVGKHFRIDSAKLWDLPGQRVPVAVAVSGDQSVRLFAPKADAMVAVEPDADLSRQWDTFHPEPTRKIGQLPVCWDPNRDVAVQRAHEQFRWFAGGWKVNAELPGTAGFAAATQFVKPEDVAANIPCGPKAGPIVDAVAEFRDAGFTDLALVQIGGDYQADFLDFAKGELLPALREA